MPDIEPLPAGYASFYDNALPGVQAGTYAIQVTHDIDAPNAGVAPATQTFAVRGPRFTIDPGEIIAQYPPAGAIGDFAADLPNVVLGTALLPWERRIGALAENVPWLALLAFADGELSGAPAGGTYAQTMTVAQMLAPANDICKPSLRLDPTDDPTASCQAITFASALFAQIVPTAAELPFLAHVRETDAAAAAGGGDGWFSVVFGNRFPAAGDTQHSARTTVHLVSLEGFEAYLGGAAPTAPAQSQVQLVSLASWTFSCLAVPAETFSDLAAGLVQTSTQRFAMPFTAQANPAPALAAAQARLGDGYCALDYHARSGEDAFAWYRGPFTPTVPNAVPLPTPLTGASGAMIFDPATGVFDQSLAAAWQIGRSLALADGAFATALSDLWRNAVDNLKPASRRDEVHDALAALFRGGIIERVAQASSRGGVAKRRDRRPRARVATRASLMRTRLGAEGALAEVFAALADSAEMATVTTWLGSRLLLEGVPFAYLVPNAGMLPDESLRAFYVDPNWTTALAGGAISAGIVSELQATIQSGFFAKLLAQGAAAALAERANAQSTPVPAPATTPLCGILVRSAIVSGWPGLRVSGTLNGTAVPLLRLDTLAPNVLLAIFNGSADTIALTLPHESIAFGIEDGGTLVVRAITGSIGARVTLPPGTGEPFVYDPEQPTKTSSAMRAGGLRVLNVISGAGDLVSSLATLLGSPTPLGPAEFALQMLQAPEQIAFTRAAAVTAENQA